MDVVVFTTTKRFVERVREWMMTTWATDIAGLFQVNEMFANDWKGEKENEKHKKVISKKRWEFSLPRFTERF